MSEEIESIQKRQGWSDETLLELYNSFLDDNDDICEKLEKYLQEIAAGENDGESEGLIDCVKSGEHLNVCDEDGNCQNCGHQDTITKDDLNSPNRLKFVSDAIAAGFFVEHYNGRGYYKGPAVRCDTIGDIAKIGTKVPLYTDSMGKTGIIAYPK